MNEAVLTCVSINCTISRVQPSPYASICSVIADILGSAIVSEFSVLRGIGYTIGAGTRGWYESLLLAALLLLPVLFGTTHGQDTLTLF